MTTDDVELHEGRLRVSVADTQVRIVVCRADDDVVVEMTPGVAYDLASALQRCAMLAQTVPTEAVQ